MCFQYLDDPGVVMCALKLVGFGSVGRGGVGRGSEDLTRVCCRWIYFWCDRVVELGLVLCLLELVFFVCVKTGWPEREETSEQVGCDSSFS